MSPAITVLMPVYNGAAFLSEAIESVLAQTFQDFEFLIIDDGSKDDSWTIIQRFGDARIRALRQENRGLAATLNIGIAMASAELIARQDQDDLMHAVRLERQLAYLTNHPDCAAVGTAAEILKGDTPSGRAHHHPQSAAALRVELLFDNPFVHSSMLLRRAVLSNVGGYCEDRTRQPPEDYELWSRLARQHDLANIDEILTEYREVAGSMSRVGESPFLAALLRISAENLYAASPNRYSFEQCMSLAALYHACPQHMPVHLGLLQALRMCREAVSSVAGEPGQWSAELQTSVARMHMRLKREAILQYLPAGAVAFVRKLRRRY